MSAYVPTTDPKTLLPCPFCGSSDAFVERADFSSCFVQCNDCGARGSTECQSSDEEKTPGHDNAVAAWNRRSPVSPSVAPETDVTPADAKRLRDKVAALKLGGYGPDMWEWMADLADRIEGKLTAGLVHDSARLDWLESAVRGDEYDDEYLASLLNSFAFDGERYRTLRAAIDAAMSSRANGEGVSTSPCLERFDHVTAPHKISQGITRPQCELPTGHEGPHGFARDERTLSRRQVDRND